MAFVLYKGIDWTRRITVTDDASGDAVDLGGKTVLVQLRRRPGDPVVATATVALLTQSGETLGQADVTIAGADSAALTVGHHCICVLVDGDVVLPPLKLPVRAL